MIHFVIAHAAEARPLIDHFHLQRLHDQHAFPCYRSKQHDQPVWLIVSGQGKLAAAIATAHLQGLSGFQSNQVWLNLGTAGHRDLSIGSTRLCHKITDLSVHKHYYPQLVMKSPWPSEALFTLDQPSNQYAHDGLLDLEASGFMQAALRYSSSELVHVIKVVSDNAAEPWFEQAAVPNKDAVRALLTPQLDSISTFAGQLQALSASLQADERVRMAQAHYQARFAFSESRQQQLRKLLQHWLALQPDIDTARLCALDGQSASAVLAMLERQVQSLMIEP